MRTTAIAQQDFRVILREELTDRQLRNPRFSLRSFARLLNLSPSTVSEVLSGKSVFSDATAKRVAQKLQMPPVKEQLFLLQVRLCHAKSPDENRRLRLQIGELLHGRERHRLTLDQFALIADWHHFAILEVLAIAPQLQSSRAIAQRLGLNSIVVDEAITRLTRLGLLKASGSGWTVIQQNTDVVGGAPSAALREYYRQLLDKARDALATQSLEQRDFSGYIFSIPKDKLALAKALLSGYMTDFEAKMAKELGGDAVYCLTTQLFRLDHDST